MTPEQQRIAFAELQGWKWKSFRHPDQDESFSRLVSEEPGMGDFNQLVPPTASRITELPDTNSRDVIMAALETMTEREWFDFYWMQLGTVLRCAPRHHLKLFRATNAQLLEAYLRTKGKWTDQ